MRSVKMILTGVAAVVAFAISANIVLGDEPPIADKIRAKFPNTPISDVRPGPVFGLYEVTMGKNIIYVDSSLRYALFGGIIDTTTGVNLTDARIHEISKVDTSVLPLKNAITIGSGKKHLYIFSDPDCPYCQKLHPELSRLKDATIHIYLLPIKELHPNAYYHAVAVWCSRDRKAALDAIFAGKPVEDQVCDNPISQNVELGKTLQITGTPTLIFDDGSMEVGYRSLQAIQDKLDGKKKEQSAGLAVTQPAAAKE